MDLFPSSSWSVVGKAMLTHDRHIDQGSVHSSARLAWFLDELIFGKVLNSTQVVAPVVEISAGRSGSTQLARYLEDDPRLVAPNLLQSLFPYLWLWKLAPYTIGKLVSPDAFRRWLERQLPPDLVERHEGDPFRTDTFDTVLYTTHLNALVLQLGPDVAVEDFGFARIAPHNHTLWEDEFVHLFDRIARKTLAHRGGIDVPQRRRFFVKGHFLCAANALEQKYPDASFLCMIRDPTARLQSAINYMRVNPYDPAFGPPPWNWLADALKRTEADYCIVEQEWFSQTAGAKRYVVRFADFVTNLQSTMLGVYAFCFGDTVLHPMFHSSMLLVNERSIASIARLQNWASMSHSSGRNSLPTSLGARRASNRTNK